MSEFTLQEAQTWKGSCSQNRYKKFIEWLKETNKEIYTLKDLLVCPFVFSLYDITFFTSNKKSIGTGNFKIPCLFVLKDVCDEFFHPVLIEFYMKIKNNEKTEYLLPKLEKLRALLDKDRQRLFTYINFMMENNFSFDILAYMAHEANHFFKEDKHLQYKEMVLNYLNVSN